MIKETPSATQKQSILLCVRCLSKKKLHPAPNGHIFIVWQQWRNKWRRENQPSIWNQMSIWSFLDSADNLTMYTITADYIELKT